MHRSMKALQFSCLLLFFLIISGCEPLRHPAFIIKEDLRKPYTHLQVTSNDDDFQFAIVSDNTGKSRPGIFASAIDKLNILQPEFVMSVGDLIEGYTENVNEISKEWKDINRIIHRLEMPFFYVPGNHDISNETMYEQWEERYGTPYYHFIYKNVLFLILNTEDRRPVFIGQQQIDYVKKVLTQNPSVRWTFVFMHRSMWVAEKHLGKRAEHEKNWHKIETLLSDRKHTVFSGHYHRYIKYTRNRSNYFTLATTGGVSKLRGPHMGEFDHITWVTFNGKPVVANLELKGIHDENVLTDEVAKDLLKVLAYKKRHKQEPCLRIQPIQSKSKTLKNILVTIELHNPTSTTINVKYTLTTPGSIASIDKFFSETLQPGEVKRQNLELKAHDQLPLIEFQKVHFNHTLSLQFPDREPIQLKNKTFLPVEFKPDS